MTFTTRRQAVTAGTSTPIVPPVAARIVKIGNASPDDLKVYSTSADETTYFIVSAGYEKEIDLKQYRFDTNGVAFYLKAVQDGTAVLIWI